MDVEFGVDHLFCENLHMFVLKLCLLKGQEVPQLLYWIGLRQRKQRMPSGRHYVTACRVTMLGKRLCLQFFTPNCKKNQQCNLCQGNIELIHCHSPNSTRILLLKSVGLNRRFNIIRRQNKAFDAFWNITYNWYFQSNKVRFFLFFK